MDHTASVRPGNHLTADFQAFFFSRTIWWLAPNELVRSQLERCLTAEDGRSDPGPFSGSFPAATVPRVLTFASLENQLASEVGWPEIDPLERHFILVDLADPLASLLHPEIDSDQNRGAWLKSLAQELGDGFDRLKLAGLTWDQVAGLKPEPLALLLAELGRSHDEILTARQQQDRFAKRRQVLDYLRSGRDFKALAEVESIICHGVQRLSPFEADFITALARGRRVELTMTVPAWVRDERIDHGSGFDLLRTIRQIEKCEEPGLWLEFKEHGDGDDPAPSALAYAADVLLAPVAYRSENPPDPSGQLTWIQVPTAYQEVEEVARYLKERLHEGDFPEELAVVVPDMNEYGPLIDDVGRRFGLAFHFRRGLTLLSESSPVLAVLSLMDLWTSHWERSRLMELIRNPYFIFKKLGPTGLTPADFHDLLLQAGVTDNRAGGGFRVNLAKLRRSKEIGAAQALLEVMEQLHQDGVRLNQAETWPDFFNQFKSILNALSWPGRLDSATQGPVNLQEADLAAAVAFQEELDHLEQALKRGPAPEVGLAGFRLWFISLLRERHLNYDPNAEGRIRVLNYYDLHGGSFEEIFFLGLNARIFPSFTNSSKSKIKNGTGWWPEDLTLSAASLLGRPLWSDAADGYRQEELMLAAGLGQARRRVWLFSRLGDESGQTALPSPLLTALMELWPDGQGGSLLPQKIIPWKPAPTLARVAGPDELWAALVQLEPQNWPTEDLRTPVNLDWWQELRRRYHMWCGMREQIQVSPSSLRIWKEKIKQYKGRPVVRASFLSALADCPYGFWWKEIMGLSSDEGALEEWPVTEEGTLLHQVLEEFFRRRLGPEKTGPLWPGGADYQELRPELLDILQKAIEQLAATKPLGRKPLWQIRSDRLGDFLSGWLKREMDSPQVQPYKVEWVFGSDLQNASPPWELPLNSRESIYLQGRVDRLDHTIEGLTVRDYKLRDVKYSIKEENIPTRAWSLLVYTLAAQDTFKKPVESFFEILDPGAPAARKAGLSTASKVMQADMAQRQEQERQGAYNFPQTLADTWVKLDSGVFAPEGEENGACDYCRFACLCPTSEVSGSEEA